MDNWINKNIKLFNGKIVTVSPICVNSCEYKQYKDARSACFYAMGVAIKDKSRVVLMIPGQYISSIYTAVTEAWFQKANITIVAFWGKITEVNTNWLVRCVEDSVTYNYDDELEILKYIKKIEKIGGPVLLNIIAEKVVEKQNDYREIVSLLRKVDEDKKIIQCYNAVNNIENIINIRPDYKYGLISKYIGKSIVKDQGYLLCDEECVLVDANIFRTRYKNSNMKIIIKDCGHLKRCNIDKWILSNGWSFKRVSKVDNISIKWFIEEKQQTVLIIG